MAVMTCMDTPVAPTGWPLDLSPPERLTGKLAVRCGHALQGDACALAVRGQAHRLVFQQLGDREAVMRLDEGQVVEREPGLIQRLRPGLRARLEPGGVAAR